MLEVAFAADKFNTSLDTLNSAAYRQIRGIDACENVKKTVAEIASVRAPKIMTVVTDGNINELDNMISYAQRHHALIYLSPMFPYMDKGGTYRISAYISDIVNRILMRTRLSCCILWNFSELLLRRSCRLVRPTAIR